MSINWNDYVIAFVLWIITTAILLTVAGILFPSVACDAAATECLTGQMRTIGEIIIPVFAAFTISTSISIIFYLYRNRKTNYKEAAEVSFSIPFICLFLFLAFLTTNVKLDQFILVFLAIPLVTSSFMALVGIFWKFVLGKILKQ